MIFVGESNARRMQRKHTDVPGFLSFRGEGGIREGEEGDSTTKTPNPIYCPFNTVHDMMRDGRGYASEVMPESNAEVDVLSVASLLMCTPASSSCRAPS